MFDESEREDAGRIHKVGTTLCDFWYFSSRKSTREEKYLYVYFGSSGINQRFAYVLILANRLKELFSSYLYYIHRKKIIFDRQALRKSAREI